jgi:hypothetical protein
MKTVLKVIGVLLVIVVVIGLVGFSYIEISGIPSYEAHDPGVTVHGDSAMVANGERMATMLCAECHLNKETNRLSGVYLPDISQFGKIYSANITHDERYGLGSWTDGQLLYFLRTGLKPTGEYAPPYMPKFNHLCDYDINSIVAWLRSDDTRLQAVSESSTPCEPNFLAKFLCHVAFKPIAYPTQAMNPPDSTNMVAYGEYIVTGKIQCFACHSESFKTLNDEEPEKTPGYMAGGNPIPDREGNIIISANLTPDPETGVGKWTEDQFVKAVKYGIRPDGTTNRYPMLVITRMTDYEAKCIFAYIKTLAPVKNQIERTVNPTTAQN